MTKVTKNIFQKGKILILSTLLLQVAFLPMFSQPALAGDRDPNAVIYDGITSLQDFANKINSGTDGRHNDIGIIFTTLGIYPEEFLKNGNIDGANRETLNGWVYKDGRVVLADGRVVAYNVISAGRSYMPGSVSDVFGLPIYWRSPSISFVPNRLSAYIHLVNGKFSWAVTKSCGNPVKIWGNPSASVGKDVRNVTKGTDWSRARIVANRGDVLEYRIIYYVGSESLNNVWLYDTLKGNTKDGKESYREYLSDPYSLKPSWFKWYPNGVNIEGYKDSRMLAWYAPGRAPRASGVAYFRTKVKDNTPNDTLICNDAALRANRLGVRFSNKVCVKVVVPSQPEPKGQLKIFKFNDRNGNGIWDTGEEPLAGFSFSVSGPENFTARTDNLGIILKTVKTGSYTITETVPSGWNVTTPNPQEAQVSSNQLTEKRFGNKQTPAPEPKGQLKIFKFNDRNGNGIWDTGEEPLAGFSFSVSGPENFTARTDNLGIILVTLTPGTYTITEEVLVGWNVTTPNPQEAQVSSNQLTEKRFGNKQTPAPEPKGQLKIFKFNDRNGNGIWDTGEEPLAGFSFSVSGPENFTARTDNLGIILVTLTPGTYTITEEVLVGWNVTTPNPQEAQVSSNQLTEKRFGNKQTPAPEPTPTPTPPAGEVLAAYTEKKIAGVPISGASSTITLFTLSSILGCGAVIRRRFKDNFLNFKLNQVINTTKKKKGL